MIYGDGLIGTAFRSRYTDFDKVVIYAQGVANSGCVDPFEFAREERLLRHACQMEPQHHLFIYFGTCSLYDEEKVDTPYVKHKAHMESIVRGLRSNWMVVRLPCVVGPAKNPYTLINQFAFSLRNSIPVALHTRAERNVIDINDVTRIVVVLIAERRSSNYSINVANTRNYTTIDIVHTLADAMDVKEYEVISLDRGSTYTIHTEAVKPIIEKLGIAFDDTYLRRTLVRYYSPTV